MLQQSMRCGAHGWWRPLAAMWFCFALAACGGSDGSVAVSQAGLVISGKVADGPLQGVRVFVDLNQDFQHDAGEPISEASQSDGSFLVDVSGVDATLLSTAQLVAWVSESAKDADGH